MFLLILAAFCIYVICAVYQEQKHHKEVAILKLKQKAMREGWKQTVDKK